MLVRGRMSAEVITTSPRSTVAETLSLVVLHLETDGPGAVVENLRRLGYESDSPALLTRPG